MTWRVSATFGEMWRNLRSSGHSSWLLVLLTGLFAFTSSAEFGAIRSAIVLSEQRQQAGANVWIASGSGGLPAGACHMLNQRGDVVAAGGHHEIGVSRLTSNPGVLVVLVAATAELVSVWDPSSRVDLVTPGYLVGSFLAEQHHLGAGSELGLVGFEPGSVTGIFGSLRNPVAARWVLTVEPPVGVVDECWVEFSPGATDYGPDVLFQVFSDSVETSVRPGLRSDDFTRDPIQEVRVRQSRLLWLLIGFGGGLGVSLLATWFRRTEYALYRTVGTPRSTLYLMAQAEGLVISLVAMLLGITLAQAWHRITNGPITHEMWVVAVRTAVSGWLLFSLLYPIPVLTIRTRTAQLLKEV